MASYIRWILGFLLVSGIFILGIEYSVHQQLIEFLKVILSWPVIFLVTILIIISNFRQQISTWLTKLKIEWGGATFSGGQEVSSATEKVSEEKLPQAQETPKDQLPDFESKTKEELVVLAKQWRMNAYLWEYRYLNRFLVYNTQRVLDWMYDVGSIDVEVANSFWMQAIPKPEERIAIFDALSQHHLIQLQDNRQMIITPKGREYIEIMGRVPELPGVPKPKPSQDVKTGGQEKSDD